MKKTLFLAAILTLLILLTTSTVLAEKSDSDDDYPWRAHQVPFDFTFGNMIDTHQQSQLSKKDKLQGFIYIHYTGEYTDDGIPIARKANCEIETCSVGWIIKGIPYQAALVNIGPRIWLIDPANFTDESGYTHFHWAGSPQKPHGLVLNNTYDGYLLKRVAVTNFYWLGGNNGQGGSSGGGCGGHESEGEDEAGCTDGGCSDEHDSEGGSSGHGGRLVMEGLDPHSNVVTDWDGTWHGGGCDD